MWQVNAAGKEPTLRAHVWVNGFVQVLKTVDLSHWFKVDDFNATHTLRIVAIGSKISTYVDGRWVDQTIDNKLSSGSIGFREASSEAATFRSVRVDSPIGKPLYVNFFPEHTKCKFSNGQVTNQGLVVSGVEAMLSSGNLRTPLLRKAFSVSKTVRRAWLYSSALGIYRASINGQKVGDDNYSPGWTNYYRRVQYQCYSVTHLLRQGTNVIGVQLAPGMFCGEDRLVWTKSIRCGLSQIPCGTSHRV